MEEILASIRQTISNERETGKVAPADAPAPSVYSLPSGAPRMGAPSDHAVPSRGRLSDALKAVPAAPANGLSSKRPSSFDDELADILDEPPAGGANGVAAPKPSISPTPDVPGLFIPRASVSKPSSASLFASLNGNSTPAPAAQDSASQSVATPDPFAKAATDNDTVPRTAPPMRRSGFYPPAGFMPKVPGAPAETNESKHSDGVLKRLGALGSVAPADPFASPAAEAPKNEADTGPVAAPSSFAVSEEDRLSAIEPDPAPSAPIFEEPKLVLEESNAAPKPYEISAPRPLAVGLAESITAAANASTPAPEATTVEFENESVEAEPSDADIEAAIAEAVSAPELYNEPDLDEPITVESVLVEPAVERFVPEPPPAQSPVDSYSAPKMNGAHTVAPRMTDTPAFAAKMALDALAQGLAASAAAHPMHQVHQSSPAGPAPEAPRNDHYGIHATGSLVPVSEPASHRPSSNAQPRASAPSGYDPNQPVRTLEDAVAEMLKPLLQQWLADNMPRIIEKALRVEAANAGKKGPRSPGA
jgi:cell pole-organizing protein PopZ